MGTRNEENEWRDWSTSLTPSSLSLSVLPTINIIILVYYGCEWWYYCVHVHIVFVHVHYVYMYIHVTWTFVLRTSWGVGFWVKFSNQILIIKPFYFLFLIHPLISYKQRGEIITILKQNENGMWEGESNTSGKRGHFPFKLVELLDSNRH